MLGSVGCLESLGLSKTRHPSSPTNLEGGGYGASQSGPPRPPNNQQAPSLPTTPLSACAVHVLTAQELRSTRGPADEEQREHLERHADSCVEPIRGVRGPIPEGVRLTTVYTEGNTLTTVYCTTVYNQETREVF